MFNDFKINKIIDFRDDLLSLMKSYEEVKEIKDLLEFVDEPLKSRLEKSLKVFFRDYKILQQNWVEEALKKFEKID